MKIFYYAYWHDHRFKNKVGGPIKVWELSGNLTRMGHTVYLFVPRIGFPEKQTSAKVQAVPILDLPILRFISFQIGSFVFSLYRIFSSGRPDIIYVRIMWSFLPMLLGKILHSPVILEVNDSPHEAYAGIRAEFKRKLVQMIDKVSLKLSSHILPVTLKIAKDLNAKDDIKWRYMTVLPSGANTDLFRPIEKSFCCQKLGFDSQKKYVGFIGTFFHHQGIAVLIDSAPEIIGACPETLFILVGDGPAMAGLRSKVAERKLWKHFIFTGQVPYKSVPYYCGVMDVCVSPYLKKAGERSPVKVFDYLACGKPVVMSEVSETGKFFAKSGAVVFVEPENPVQLGNAITDLLSNGEKRHRMGRKARSFIKQHYDRKQIAGTVESIANKLTGLAE